MEKILLAVDGSEGCKKATKKVTDLLNSIEAKVTILTIIERNISLPAIASKSQADKEFKKQDELEKEAYKITGLCAKKMENKAKEVDRIVETGNPAEIICRIANSGNYSLVVVSDIGESNIEKFFLGSTTEKVIRFCSKTVMVVK